MALPAGLERRVGPLKVWQIGALVAAGGVGLYLYRKRKAGAAAPVTAPTGSNLASSPIPADAGLGGNYGPPSGGYGGSYANGSTQAGVLTPTPAGVNGTTASAPFDLFSPAGIAKSQADTAANQAQAPANATMNPTVPSTYNGHTVYTDTKTGQTTVNPIVRTPDGRVWV